MFRRRSHHYDVGALRSHAVRTLCQNQLRVYRLFHGRARPSWSALLGKTELFRGGCRTHIRRSSPLQQRAQVLLGSRLPVHQKYVSSVLYKTLTRSYIDRTVLPANNTISAFTRKHSLAAPPRLSSTYYSFIDPKRMNGWDGHVGWHLLIYQLKCITYT